MFCVVYVYIIHQVSTYIITKLSSCHQNMKLSKLVPFALLFYDYCTVFIEIAKPRTCNEKNGWNYLDNWISNKKNLLKDGSGGGKKSRIVCGKGNKLSVLCSFQNIMMDFSKASVSGSVRKFGQGFVTADGTWSSSKYDISVVAPGLFVREGALTQCEYTEERPTFIMSHDDIYNFGHHMNDVAMVSVIIWLLTGIVSF